MKGVTQGHLPMSNQTGHHLPMPMAISSLEDLLLQQQDDLQGQQREGLRPREEPKHPTFGDL
jgi:hypothetical protein